MNSFDFDVLMTLFKLSILGILIKPAFSFLVLAIFSICMKEIKEAPNKFLYTVKTVLMSSCSLFCFYNIYSALSNPSMNASLITSNIVLIIFLYFWNEADLERKKKADKSNVSYNN